MSDPTELAELRDLPSIDIDPRTADRIAARARAEVGRGEPPWRRVEAVIITVFSSGFLVWTVLKIIDVFR